MKGKVVLITGATSGIGKETAIGLGQMGATIVFTTRNEERGNIAKDEIIQRSGSDDVHVLFCDLASFDSIKNFCAEFQAKYDRLDVLINNAGQWDYQRRVSKDGIENMWATNFLAPFLMTHLLLPLLEKSAPSRIISLSSGLHQGTINFDDVEFKKKFKGMKVYRQSKLALILFTRLLAKKLEGKNITVNCLMPGMVATNLGRDAGTISKKIFGKLGKSPEKGAETPIFLASSPDVTNITGENFANKKVVQSSKESHNMETANRMWKVAEEYTGIQFGRL